MLNKLLWVLNLFADYTGRLAPPTNRQEARLRKSIQRRKGWKHPDARKFHKAEPKKPELG